MESLLGEHSNLVNLDNLVQVKIAFQTIFFLILTLQPKVSGGTAKNPFADQPNPFQAAAAPKPTINQLRTSGQVLFEDEESNLLSLIENIFSPQHRWELGQTILGCRVTTTQI